MRRHAQKRRWARVKAVAVGRRDTAEMEVIAAERPDRIVERTIGAGGRRVTAYAAGIIWVLRVAYVRAVKTSSGASRSGIDD